ncbi:hypothetical protein [Embleya hyalina]|uniref:Putative baseplate assembly protein n=1 Tax=Embleya hyalina TaxID=516124 RepID=A0A401Z4M5_9ACTN|nr:hypothetical protein [Embleya hyalina]GCE01788.1 putative baseplate assembly protein [Embleya hyalina]
MDRPTLPDLDDTPFQQLVDAAKRTLPDRAPGWTDHNVSDPGITLIEACAQRVDQLLYRVDRTTPAVRARLLRLMGIAPAPASPTRVRLRVTRPPKTALPADTPLTTADGLVLYTTTALAAAKDTLAEAACLRRVHETLGVSTGEPGQRFAAGRRPHRPDHPLDPDESFLRVAVDGEPWRVVPTFARRRVDDRVHIWDDACGEVVFGPRVPYAEGARRHGGVPSRGAVITAAYRVGVGSPGALSVGTILTGSDVEAVITSILSPGADAEDVDQALRRARLDLTPPARAVTAADLERVLDDLPLLARVRVGPEEPAPADPVPVALQTPPRPSRVDTAWAVDQQRVVLVSAGTCIRSTLDGKHVEHPQMPFARADAVLWFEPSHFLWSLGDHYRWNDDATQRPITDLVPNLEPFTRGLDAACVQPAVGSDAVDLFFFVDDRYCHCPARYANRKLTPTGAPVVSTIAVDFPALPRVFRSSPDAVVVVGDTFHFLKGDRTATATRCPDERGLRVSLVPASAADPTTSPGPDEAHPPGELVGAARSRVESTRMLGQHVTVGGCAPVSFDVHVTVRPWDGVSDVREIVARRLHAYFHPRVGGPDGRGWPWGRPVHTADVFSALEDVAEIHRVVDTMLRARGARVDVVTLPEHGLPRLCEVDVATESDI